MSTDSIGMGMGSVGMGQGASTLDLQGLLRSGSHVDLGAELYEDSLNLSMPRSDSVQVGPELEDGMTNHSQARLYAGVLATLDVFSCRGFHAVRHRPAA